RGRHAGGVGGAAVHFLGDARVPDVPRRRSRRAQRRRAAPSNGRDPRPGDVRTSAGRREHAAPPARPRAARRAVPRWLGSERQMKDANASSWHRLTAFIGELEQRKIPFALRRNRIDAVTVEVPAPGERWEVDFLDDGTIDVERFRSDGTIY